MTAAYAITDALFAMCERAEDEGRRVYLELARRFQKPVGEGGQGWTLAPEVGAKEIRRRLSRRRSGQGNRQFPPNRIPDVIELTRFDDVINPILRAWKLVELAELEADLGRPEMKRAGSRRARDRGVA